MGIDARIHADDQLVGEATLTLAEEVIEGLLEFTEGTRALDDFRLHLRRQLVVEVELLDDHVKIVLEGCLDVFLDVAIEPWLDEFALV